MCREIIPCAASPNLLFHIIPKGQYLATMVVKQYARRPHTLAWIAHAPVRRGLSETCDLGQSPWEGPRFHTPRWRHLEPAYLARLVMPCRRARCVARHALAGGNGRMGHSTPQSAALAELKTLLENL